MPELGRAWEREERYLPGVRAVRARGGPGGRGKMHAFFLKGNMMR